MKSWDICAYLTVTGRSLAVEWVGFARANSVSPGYIKTDISAFIPAETKNIFKDKIPMGYVVSLIISL